MKKNISILIALLVMGTSSFAQKANTPQIESLRDNTTVRAEELACPDAISWTPVQPSKAGGNVTYKLSIWPVEKGQSTAAAMRMKPMLDKPYKNKTSASGIETSLLQPGKDYVCIVQAVDDNGKGIGENEGRGGDITIHIAPAKGSGSKKCESTQIPVISTDAFGRVTEKK